jgi:hypothetical protein
LEDLNFRFGTVKRPNRVDSWEEGATPRSLVELDAKTGKLLKKYRTLSQSNLMKFDAMAKRFIWAINADGKLLVAVEELAGMPDGRDSVGHPRRRKFPIHPAQERKLGHPCLVNGLGARIAGELFVDETGNGTLVWYINVKSGRYCRDEAPNSNQEANVLQLFRTLIDQTIVFDVLT